MKAFRLFLTLGLLLARLLADAQGWDKLPSYTFRSGGRAQVRRIIFCEDHDRLSPGFVKLRDSTSIAELVKLSRRHNPAMQLYAAMALADRHYPRLPDVFAHLIRTDHPIRYSYYRWGTEHIYYAHASEKLYSRMRYSEAAARSHLRPAFPSRADSLLYETLLQQMDSVILRLATEGKHVHYSLLATCLEHNKGYPGSYAYVRKLCGEVNPQDWKNREYATALAAYRREQDLPLLLQFDDNAFAAAAQFPHPTFWPLIEKYRAPNKWSGSYEYYQGVAAFNNQRAAQLLDSIARFIIQEKGAASNMAWVLSKADLTVFSKPIERLWVQHHAIRASVAAQLVQRGPAQAAKLFAQGFLSFNSEGKSELERRGDYGPSNSVRSDTTATMMLRAIWQQDSAAFRAVSRHGVQQFRWDELTALCLLDKQYHFPWFRPLLVAELKATRQPFDQYMVANKLLDYEEAATTALVRKIVAESTTCQLSNDSWCQPLLRRLTELAAVVPAKP